MSLSSTLKSMFKSKPIQDKKESKYLSAPTTAYRSSGQERLRSDWITSAMSNTTPPAYELNTLRARSRDLIRNDAVSNAVIDTFLTSVIGQGLQVQSAITAKSLGVSEKKAGIIREACETVFNNWKPYADRASILNFDEYQRLAFRKILEDGEAIVIPTWDDSEWRPYGRCLQMLESEELDSHWTPNSKTVNGITFDSGGAPVTYWLKKYTKSQWGDPLSRQPTPLSARAPDGSPNILHIFETLRPNQTRGIPKLAPVLDKFEELNEYLEAELVSARVSACLSVFVQKADPMQAAMAMSNDTDSNDYRLQDVEPGVINYLAPGETIQVVDPKRSDSLGQFMDTVLRTIGMSLGLPYELLVKDFSKTNYSSARAALLEARRQFTYYRQWIAQRLCQPIYEMVLEEAYLRGDLPITQSQYENNWPNITKSTWIGAPWGQIDEVKETQAAILRINAGLSTYSHELSGVGKEWNNIFAQRARENELIDELELNFLLSTVQSKGDTDTSDINPNNDDNIER